jgi:hypothetical protein
MPSAHFYSELPVHHVTLSELLGDESRFVQVPTDWHVVVTDIRNSTIALGAGRHEAVNLIATGSIIATLNLARKKNVGVPFFFGGDGATMLVPPALLDPVIRALTTHRENGLANFDLDLRVGSGSVAGIACNRKHPLTKSSACWSARSNLDRKGPFLSKSSITSTPSTAPRSRGTPYRCRG